MGKNTERGPLPLWRKWVRIAERVAKHKKQTKTNKLTELLHSPQAKSNRSSLLEKSENSSALKIRTQSKPIWAPDLTSDFTPQWLSACNAGDTCMIPGSGRFSEGNANPLQYSCLGNTGKFMGIKSGVWWVTVHRVAKSRTWLSN